MTFCRYIWHTIEQRALKHCLRCNGRGAENDRLWTQKVWGRGRIQVLICDKKKKKMCVYVYYIYICISAVKRLITINGILDAINHD